MLRPEATTPDTNPSRITPRNVLDAAPGPEKIWKRRTIFAGAEVTVVNRADKVALYNFPSSFSGAHFVTPRSVQGEITLHF